jgi:hypothetical protein
MNGKKVEDEEKQKMEKIKKQGELLFLCHLHDCIVQCSGHHQSAAT